MKRPGFTLTESLIIGTLFGMILIVSSIILGSERARTRDAKRIADISRFASSFSILYAEKASFSSAAVGCPNVGDEATKCTFSFPLIGPDAPLDPGNFKYTISRVPDKENFGILFKLEKKYGSLQAGPHILSKTGIQ